MRGGFMLNRAEPVYTSPLVELAVVSLTRPSLCMKETYRSDADIKDSFQITGSARDVMQTDIEYWNESD